MTAPFVLGGPIDHGAFETYVEKVLVPVLRTVDSLWNAIGQACECFIPDECAICFAAAGCDPK